VATASVFWLLLHGNTGAINRFLASQSHPLLSTAEVSSPRGTVLPRPRARPYHPRFLRCVRLTWHAVTGAPHRLLLSHFSNWSQVKGREVDVQLLEGLLDLRATYDDLEPTLWPTGSVQDLLLRLLL
jgi:hypothetical protein